jgi:hypothetical protein
MGGKFSFHPHYDAWLGSLIDVSERFGVACTSHLPLNSILGMLSRSLALAMPFSLVRWFAGSLIRWFAGSLVRL